MGGNIDSIRLHRSASNQIDKGNPENNLMVKGTKIEIWNGKSHVDSEIYGTPTVDLREDSWALMNAIAGMTKEKDETKPILTEQDFEAFKAKYETDKNFKAQINKAYNVSNITFGENGVTNVDFLDKSGSPDFKIDFETKAEKDKAEADAKIKADVAAKQKAENAAKEQARKDSIRDSRTVADLLWDAICNRLLCH